MRRSLIPAAPSPVHPSLTTSDERPILHSMSITLRPPALPAPLVALLLAVLGGCSGSEEPELVPATVAVTPASASFDAVGKTRSFVASVRDQNGDPLPLAQVTWSSSASGVAAVDAQGTVTAVSNGTATVRASAGSASGSAAVVVDQRAVLLDAAGGDGQTGEVAAPLPSPLRVRALDARSNPAPGITIQFEITDGAGVLTAPSAITDAAGIAETSWTLGPVAGDEQSVEATVPGAGIGGLRFSATAIAGPAATMDLIAGDGQAASQGSELPVEVEIRLTDDFGNPVPGALVDFEPVSGDGAAAPSQAPTDVQGRARTRWTLGSAVGTQLLGISSGAAEATAEAIATLAPGRMTVAAGDGQTATVDTEVATPPAVLLTTDDGVPVSDAVIGFTVTSGDGRITSGGTTSTSLEVTTDDAGIAALDGWRLGTTAGLFSQTVTASTAGVDDLVFTATAEAGAPEAFIPLSGGGQSAMVGTALPDPVEVEVRDRFANPVSGVPVNFTVVEGEVSPASDLSDATGRAATTWTLGPTQGTQELTASIGGGIPDLTFSAIAASDGGGGVPECEPADAEAGFQIQLCYLTSVTTSVEAAFDAAVARWGELIVGDLSEITTTLRAGTCGSESPRVSGTIDDVIIFVSVEPIDGEFGILGSAGPCQVRFDDPATRLPLGGSMRFDEADLDRLETDGDLEAVILHEMGHVLGIGTLWNFGPYDFLENPVGSAPDPSKDTHFDGPQAIAAFDAAGGAGRTDAKVPVENAQGGGGTLDSHWRESTMDNELMTGFLDGGRSNPLSAISVASLADLGYDVDLAAADAYTVVNPDGVPPLRGGGRHIELPGDILRLPIYLIGADGAVVGVVRR